MNAQDLKNSILQLAVQGRLVPQDSADEPASELLKRIRKEKERLIAEGKIRKEQPLPAIGEDEIQFDIPDTWQWVRLGEIFTILMGQSPDGNNVFKGEGTEFHQGKIYFGEKYILKSPQVTKQITKLAPPNSLLLCVRAPVGNVNITDRPICIGRGLAAIVMHDHIRVDFAYYWFHTLITSFNKKATGSTFKAISGKIIENEPFPLPPLAEQSRIVAKIEELLPKVTEYGEAQDRLTALNAEVPDKLRKSILQQAVQGKLTDRDPSDEPSSLLLDRIRAEKARLIKEGKLRKEKPIPPITDDEIPFDIPETWEWVRLGNIVTVNGGKRIPAGRTLSDLPTQYKYIRVTDMKNNTVCLDKIKYVPEDIFPHIQQYIIHKEDVYITVAGTIGAVGEIPEELDGANLTENADKLVFHHLNKKWLIQVLSSPCLQEQIIEATNKMSQPKLAIQRIQQLLIPLPPLAEQARIVERVETLLAKCSDLK